MSVIACPGCAAGTAEPAPAVTGDGGGVTRLYQVSIPSVHCAGCISGVERGVAALPGFRGGRVNLTRRRLTVSGPDGAEAEAALLAALDRIGHPGEILDTATLGRAEADPVGRALLMRLGIAGFAAMNVMLLSVGVWSGAEGATRDLLHWVSAGIALPAAAIAAQPFFVNAWAALRRGRMVMDTPISLAILLALAMSLYETVNSGTHAYFDAALSLTFFLLLGRVLDHRSRAAARSAAAELTALEVPRAERLGPAGVQTVPVAQLAVGERIQVRPGLRVPADGTVVDGRTEVDRSLLTGETAPVPVRPGRAVHAGDVNLTGRIVVAVTAIGEDSALRRIADLVRAAEGTRNAYVSLADKAAKVYAPVVHLLALTAGLGWYLAGADPRFAINVAVALLIITCPCALGLAVPAVMVSASGALFRKGVLLKDGTALERLAKVDAAVLDKTGTLTFGMPKLDAARIDDTALAIAAGLGGGSAHPLARAVEAAAADRGLRPAVVDQLREVPGSGVEGRWRGRPVRLGRAAWIGAPVSAAAGTESWLSIEGMPLVRLPFTDRPRAGLAEMVAGLRRRCRRVLLLSGDAPGPVQALAADLDLEAQAGLSPEEKHARIAALQTEGARVLMVGDGMNDTAALARADVSVAPSSGMDVARSAADIVLLTPDLKVIPEAIDIAARARARMIENFALAAGYNCIAIPIAIAGHATPLAAALAMSASSICVSLNALRVAR